jgi:hypothetical protein
MAEDASLTGNQEEDKTQIAYCRVHIGLSSASPHKTTEGSPTMMNRTGITTTAIDGEACALVRYGMQNANAKLQEVGREPEIGSMCLFLDE